MAEADPILQQRVEVLEQQMKWKNKLLDSKIDLTTQRLDDSTDLKIEALYARIEAERLRRLNNMLLWLYTAVMLCAAGVIIALINSRLPAL